MSGEWHFSRIRLSGQQGVRAIASLLQPDDDDQRAAAMHRLLWNLFAETPEDKRDFLWREIAAASGDRAYYVLSPRPPIDRNNLFYIETKPYEIAPRAGARFAFDLRVNATVQRKVGGKPKRHDIVMDGLRQLAPGTSRNEARDALAQRAGAEWLARKGEWAGFKLTGETLVETYQTWRLPRDGQRAPLSLGVLDMKGIMEVTDPEVFVPAILGGFGRAKAFGLGMVLLRRA